MSGFFITATNTDAGKTFVTAALLKAFLDLKRDCVAIKPIQSGFNDPNSIDTKIYKSVNPKNDFAPKYLLKKPTSPHYAALCDGVEIDFGEVLNYCGEFLENHEISLIEGAGGIYVPITPNLTMLDLIKALNLETILVCKNELGMLNHALLSIEALQNSGVKIAAIVLNLSDENDEICASNVEFLKTKFDGEICVLPKCEIAKAAQILAKFAKNHKTKTEKIDLNFDREHLWHPYTSALSPLKSYAATGAKGSYIFTENGALLDGMSSWWCACLGYANDEIKAAATAQLNQMPHIMFGGLTHAPAVNLGKKLLSLLPSSLSQIFYCDSGSVSVEVALKMAFQYQQNRNPSKTKIATIRGGYHGDTFGAMGICDPVNGMHHLFSGILQEAIFLEKPEIPYGSEFNDAQISKMRETLLANRDKIAAIIVEPLVQGAGGMWFYHENYLKFFREIADEMDALLIFDEVATGFGRTGEMFACTKSGVTPDIITLGKALTAGTMSFACVVASKKVANMVSLNGGVLMHGPTFMANPLACAVALKSIELIERINFREKVAKIEEILRRELAVCAQFSEVCDVRVMGAIGVVEISQNVNVEKIQEFFVKMGVFIRPFGRNIYVMPHFTASEAELKTLCAAIAQAIEKKAY